MKLVLKLLLVVLSLSCCLSVFPQQQDFFKNFKIDCSFQQTPQINAPNVAGLPVAKLDMWLVINVTCTTVSKTDKNRQPEWLDDVSFEYEVLVPGFKGPVYLSGTTTYWAIPLDGKEHHSVGFIHPRFLQRYAPELKSTSPSAAKDTYIRIKVTMNQAIIGGAVNPERKAMEVANAFKKAATDPNILRVNDSVYGIDKTPWRDLNYDYYELIKPVRR